MSKTPGGIKNERADHIDSLAVPSISHYYLITLFLTFVNIFLFAQDFHDSLDVGWRKLL